MLSDSECQTELLSENHLRWACRRGMLELDILLGGFLNNGYQLLSENEKQIFQSLLLESDQTLLELFMNQQASDDDGINCVVKKIRSAAAY